LLQAVAWAFFRHGPTRNFTEGERGSGCALFESLQQLLQLQDLSLQQTPANSSSLADLDTLLLGVDDAGFFVALGFDASVVFVELFWRLGNHTRDFGGFGKLRITQPEVHVQLCRLAGRSGLLC